MTHDSTRPVSIDAAEPSTIQDSPPHGEPTPIAGPLAAPGSGEVPVRSLDHLELQGVIGRGGMGIVYRAWDPVLQRYVALKRIRDGLVARADDVTRFYREARAAAQLRHTNIVPIFDLGLFQGEYAFTMTLLTGGTLADHATRFSDPATAVDLIIKIARAVHLAHQRNIVHRDLKLSNIFLDEKGEPLVGDFGLAKLLEADVELTQAGTMMGTPAYMAPEQFPGSRTPASPQSDVWSLGVMLHELLTGSRPFLGISWQDIADQVDQGDRPPIPGQPGLSNIIGMCLQKKASRRYPSAEALAADLERWRNGQPLHAPSPSRPFRKRLVLAALLLLAAGGLTWALLSGFFSFERKLPDPLVLVGEKGMPRAAIAQVLFDPAVTMDVEGDDGYFTVDTRKGCLLLFDSSPWDNYRLEAEVLPQEGKTAGLVFGHVRTRFNQAIHDSYLTVTCEGLAGQRGRVQVDLRNRLDPPQPASDASVAYYHPGQVDTLIADQSRWQLLAVEIHPDRFHAEWTDTKGTVHTSQVMKALTVRNSSYGLVPLDREFMRDFRPEQGLGLYLAPGKASFRRVILHPLRSESR